MTPLQAIDKNGLKSRFSAQNIADSLSSIVVGCAECHTLNSGTHSDRFFHNGYYIHTVVTPEDCNVCHPLERAQYKMNLMSNAHVNLSKNPTYNLLIKAVNGRHWQSTNGSALYIK